MLAGFAYNLRVYANRSRRRQWCCSFTSTIRFRQRLFWRASLLQTACGTCAIERGQSAPLVSQACPLSAHKGGNLSLEGKQRRAGVMSVLP